MLNPLYNKASTLGPINRLGLVMMLGVMSSLALPPWHIIPLILPAFTGFIWFLILAEKSQNPLRASFTTGLCFGFGHFLLGIHWIIEPLLIDGSTHAWLIPFALIGLPAGLAIFIGITSFLTSFILRFYDFSVLGRILLFSIIWVFSEWVRGWFLSGFPWNLIGYVWADITEVMQVTAFIGIFGLSFITLLASTIPALLVSNFNWKKIVLVVFFSFIVPSILWTGGSNRLAGAPNYEEQDTGSMVQGVRLRIVQANIPQKDKWKPNLQTAHLLRHIKMSREDTPISPTHVIWPESAIPFLLEKNNSIQMMVASAAPEGGLLFTGSISQVRDEKSQFRNSLYVINPSGKIIDRYDKVRLVPFGEYMPLADWLPFDKIVPSEASFISGPTYRTMDLPGLPRLSPLICYEAIFPNLALKAGVRGEWLLNLTNDAWFGKFAGPQQHLAIASTRAIEHGVPMVRAANTGISAIVDPYGRKLLTLGLGEQGVLDSGLPKALPYATIYSRWQETIAIGLIGLVVLLLWYMGLLKRNRGLE